MSLNTIRLTPGMLADLYATTLVETRAPGRTGDSLIPVLGDRQSKTLIVANSRSEVNLTEEESSFLNSILGACRLSLSGVAVVNWKAAAENGKSILEQIAGVRVVLFGIDPVTFGLPMSFPLFQNQEFDKRTYLFAPGLTELVNDVSLKKQLWEALKKLFQL